MIKTETTLKQRTINVRLFQDLGMDYIWDDDTYVLEGKSIEAHKFRLNPTAILLKMFPHLGDKILSITKQCIRDLPEDTLKRITTENL